VATGVAREPIGPDLATRPLVQEALMVKRRWLLLLVLPLSAGGCSRHIEETHLDAKGVAAKAMEQYDTNRDGVLDAQELKRCPGLEACAKRIHRSNKDPRLTQDELEQVLAEYVEGRTGIMALVCHVTLDGEALPGAEVVLEPEAFLGDSVKPSHGTTDEKGKARVQMEGAPTPGCNYGIYRVRISKTGPNGREMLPARYNKETQLGIEVGPGLKGSSTFPFPLRAR